MEFPHLDSLTIESNGLILNKVHHYNNLIIEKAADPYISKLIILGSNSTGVHASVHIYIYIYILWERGCIKKHIDKILNQVKKEMVYIIFKVPFVINSVLEK